MRLSRYRLELRLELYEIRHANLIIYCQRSFLYFAGTTQETERENAK